VRGYTTQVSKGVKATHLHKEKDDMHVLQMQIQAVCVEGGNGWHGSGDRAVMPAQPCHHRFLCCVSSGVGVLAVGGVVAEVRTGQDTAKKGPLTWRGDSKGR